MIRTLTFTTLYPNPTQPRHGVFVENRLQKLLETGHMQTVVVAPVPWYPQWAPDIRGYSRFKNIPLARHSSSIDVLHPKYPAIPKLGMSIAPLLLANAVTFSMRRLIDMDGPFNLIDAHYFYPDGVAAAIVASRLNLPLVITARGSDINLISEYFLPRKQILWAARRAEALISVSDALKNTMVDLGVSRHKITTLRNGVDPAIFFPVDRQTARRRLGLSGQTLLSVGNLIESKGHHLVVEALTTLPDHRLLIVGGGEWASNLAKTITELDLDDRVTMVGEVAQSDLKTYYTACDAVVLASRREGMPNVLLESLACGCPIVATNVGGAPEIVKAAEAGVLIPTRTVDAVRDGIRNLFANLPDRSATHKYSKAFSWEPTTQGQLAIFEAAIESRDRAA